ncbi:MAG: MFS transporter [Actinomycetota bacterium]
MSTEVEVAGPWSPLRRRVFRWLWISSLVSNLGTIMHTVGAGWAITSLTSSPAVVSLAQTAWTVPGFLFALLAGAIADVIDRRRVIVVTQASGMVVAAALGVLEISGHLDVPLLLLGTFLLSVALTLSAPAFIALLPELVPIEELPQAIGLNAIAYNGPQSLGPALAGVVIAFSGPGAVFLLNAVSFLGIVIIVNAYRPPVAMTTADETVMAAMRTGLRYFRGHRSLQRFAVRIMLAFAVTSAVTALLPVVARHQLHVAAGSFGLLAAALGVGAVLAIWLLPAARLAAGPDVIVAVAGIVWAAGAGLLAVTHTVWVAIVGLVFAGVGQMATMNTVYSLFMTQLPAWVRGRSSSVVMLVVWLGASVGAFGWGALASGIGIGTALGAAAATQLAVTVLAYVPLRLDRPDTFAQ